MLTTSTQVAARTLGYAILHASSAEGRLCISNEILACDRDLEILAGLAHLYIFGLIRVCKAPPLLLQDSAVTLSSSNPPPPPPPPPPKQLKDEVRMISYCLCIGSNYLHMQLMHRERRRCALTGAGDQNSLFSDPVHPDVEDIPESERGKFQDLQVAHIISQPLTNEIGGLTKRAKMKLSWASSAAAILDRFSGIEIEVLLGNLDLHNPLNAMLLSHVVHEMLNSLRFSLEGARVRFFSINCT
ncbi:hypothetical protein C8R47DRAFT_1238475 [Mycena vitilis]|nr:hypothetical protein C8R47DRAFT_1238475 [Mycena vitilis]